jgi:ATP-dependent helicase YprA (DUF1998 family)/very-short-patch-repair endonuclease
LFGSPVLSEHVIGETLRRTTPLKNLADPAFVQALTARVKDASQHPPTQFEAFINDPLSIWIETTLGIQQETGTGRLIRARPRRLRGEEGAALELSNLTDIPVPRCEQALQEGLLAGYSCSNPETGFPVFAFRLHQFISKGDTVHASVESEAKRYITTEKQKYVPDKSRERVLLPLAFCRECGQEYYSVRLVADPNTGHRHLEPRELNDLFSKDDNEAGFIFVDTQDPWPDEGTPEYAERLPDDWVEERNGALVIRTDRRRYRPRKLTFNLQGDEDPAGMGCHFAPAPFHFCLNCRVSYGMNVRSDYGSLAELSSEGRSTATTILTMTAITALRKEGTLATCAQKLLSFTDNRQDASLQAGHFNDFIEIGLLRSALYQAVEKAGDSGVRHEELTQKVFEALNLPKELFARRPDAKFQEDINVKRALREVIGYRLYRDLKRGWRITSPNLEQSGLVEIRYPVLDELCQAKDEWQNLHPALVGATATTRQQICRVLLDFMRRELAIRVDFLKPDYQDQIKQQSSQHLVQPWDIDDKETMEHAAVLFPRPRRSGDYGGYVFVSPRGGFGRFLKRATTFPDYDGPRTTKDVAAIIQNLLDILRVGGLVEVVEEAEDSKEVNAEGGGVKTERAVVEKAKEVNGYQLSASAMLWRVGDGSRSFHDPIRVPNVPESGRRTNPFFVSFYKAAAGDIKGLEAREHTAQVDYDERQKRERRFRRGSAAAADGQERGLPVLFCSPTMELGVDISELNVVNMRNVPPTPANYAQRSGRAGRSGQPALVFSYCTTGSSHDQYFFKRPENMVAGAVTPPRLDLANEDLIRAHLHAVWLTETRMSLHKSLKDILDVSGDPPALRLLQSVKDTITEGKPKLAARVRSKTILATLGNELQESDWYSDKWLAEVFDQVHLFFDRACDRWRGLYLSAFNQSKAQSAIILDATRSSDERDQAKRLRADAESQLSLLRDIDNLRQSDFYSYRYFASEGFLPGYNFPRLPLSAYIPARRTGRKDEFLSRPRFLAISEFGPRSFIYHEGARYIINGVILPVGNDDVLTQKVKICPACGYLHPIADSSDPDICDRCHDALGQAMTQLFRMENVVTKRRDNINCDEEERRRMGYEITTSVRFGSQGGVPSYKLATVEADGQPIAKLSYGHTAVLWRINMGFRRRADKAVTGFMLDTERGYWAKNEQNSEDEADPLSDVVKRVIPFVRASLQAALKHAIQVEFELEDNELAAEPLPNRDTRNLILLYEASEGGAGVLRQLLDTDAFVRVCRRALALCHFDPDTGADLGKAPRSKENCEAACYDCLMNYGNQPDHRQLDRKKIRDLLLQMVKAKVATAPAPVPRATHLANLMKRADTGLERKWLQFLEQNNLRLPTEAQRFFAEGQTRPDFYYADARAAIYVDGPPHDYPERQQRDQAQGDGMMNAGYLVIRFKHTDNWGGIAGEYPSVF